MRKNILKAILLASVMCVSVSGCNNGNKLKLVQVDPYAMTGANHRNMRVNGGIYYGEQYTELTKMGKDDKLQTTYAINDVKALIVPVDFPDCTFEKLGGESRISEILNDSILAEGKTDWYSLSEFYHSSSFGQCNISGRILPTWHYDVSVKDINKSGKDTGHAAKIALQIQEYYCEHNDKVNLAEYDCNKDGFVDSLIMVYSADISTTGELWWAFCSHVTGAYGKWTPSGNLMGVNRFFWASIKFLFETNDGGFRTDKEIAEGTVKPDAHTLIHEYGHVLSLPDYYVADYAKNDYSGLGALDMMDNNIGDHNAFSKMLYGWINPRRVTGKSGSVKATLKSTTTTGDTIIIPAADDWNDTYLDQYLVIEFLTPEGVAKADGENKYLGHYPLYYSKAGIRITHVDARMGLFTYASNAYVFSGYTWTTKPQDGVRGYVSFAADNTASRSCYPNYKLIEVLPATGVSQEKSHASFANDEFLYYEGDEFGTGDVFADFKFNGISGEKDKEFGFKIKVNKINGNESAQITISR